MLGYFKDIWKAISSGWVVEYLNKGHAPNDFFNQKHGKEPKDRTRWGRMTPKWENEVQKTPQDGGDGNPGNVNGVLVRDRVVSSVAI